MIQHIFIINYVTHFFSSNRTHKMETKAFSYWISQVSIKVSIDTRQMRHKREMNMGEPKLKPMHHTLLSK